MIEKLKELGMEDVIENIMNSLRCKRKGVEMITKSP
jgi:hypothetical protein